MPLHFWKQVAFHFIYQIAVDSNEVSLIHEGLEELPDLCGDDNLDDHYPNLPTELGVMTAQGEAGKILYVSILIPFSPCFEVYIDSRLQPFLVVRVYPSLLGS